jgi:hypothetical protein
MKIGAALGDGMQQDKKKISFHPKWYKRDDWS